MSNGSKKRQNGLSLSSAAGSLTRAQARDLADLEARKLLGLSSRMEAFTMLDAGKLSGTIAEAEFKMLRKLTDE